MLVTDSSTFAASDRSRVLSLQQLEMPCDSEGTCPEFISTMSDCSCLSILLCCCWLAGSA